MDHSEACDFSSRRRRDDAKRRRVEAAVDGLVRRYGLPLDAALTLSEGIYGLYRKLITQKSLDDQDRQHREWKHHAHDFAERTANASDTEVSVYVADMREFAAHMIRLDTHERRNLDRGKAIEQASKATWDHSRRRKSARRGNISHALSFPATRLDGRRERSSF
jgi:hypothetical protein